MNDSLNTFLLLMATALGAVTAAFWLAFVIWTYNDMKARSRDPLAQIAAAVMVAVLFIFGLIIYVMLRPRETLSDAYERSLEEEALLQGIEEKPACPGCGRPTRHEWQVCPFCHTKLKKNCVSCHQLLELSWNLCPYCAVPQTASEASSALPASDSAYVEPRRANSIASQLQSPYAVSGYESSYERPPSRKTPAPSEGGVEWVESEY